MSDRIDMTTDTLDFVAAEDDAAEAEFVIISLQQKTREADDADSHDRWANLESPHLADEGADGAGGDTDPYANFSFTVDLG